MGAYGAPAMRPRFGGSSRPPWAYIATVQGQALNEHVRHAEELAPLISQQSDH
jgi:hypothetical protein